MEIVVPLRVQGIAAGGAGIDDANIFKTALGDDPGLPLQTPGLILEFFRQLIEDMMSAEVVDAVDRVQAKGIDVQLGQPVERVVDEVAAHRFAVGVVMVIASPQGVP